MDTTLLIDIGGGTWEILTVVPRHDMLMSGSDECLGMTYFHEKKIYIANTTNLDTWFQTLFHEIVHAIAYEYNVNSLLGEENHDDVDRLGLAIYDILKRNEYIVDADLQKEETNETIN